MYHENECLADCKNNALIKKLLINKNPAKTYTGLKNNRLENGFQRCLLFSGMDYMISP
jgi:hypothetical protein